MTTATAPRKLLAWRPRLTIRTRLTLSYAALVSGSGAILILVVYLFMRFVPNYAITSARLASTDPADPMLPLEPALPAAPYPSSVDGTAIPGASTISITSAADVLDTLLISSLIALVVLTAIGALISWLIAGKLLRPLKAINTAATIAATGSLDHRVAIQGPRDEIRDLSDTFDEMLGALDRAFRAHRRFAANASHELRTPLATTQTMIDVTLADPHADTETLRTLATRIHQVNRRNIQTVEALLSLANIDQKPLRCIPVDLHAVSFDAIDTLLQEARDHNVTITLRESDTAKGPMTAHGDPSLIRQALNNLLQNAIRHNIEPGSVEIQFEQRAAEIAVRIGNTGRIIAQDIVESLREPFVRGAGRTVSPVPGHGLGLAIAASIIDAHRGSLHLTANLTGGLTVELSLPSGSPVKMLPGCTPARPAASDPASFITTD